MALRGDVRPVARFGAALSLLMVVACSSGPKPRVVRTAPSLTNIPAPVKAAVRAANAAPGGARWKVEQVVDRAGARIEQYRLGGGPQLVLLPEASPTAVTVQVWLPAGWGDEAPGEAGRMRRWTAGWPERPLGPRVPQEAWRGTARDLAGASWTVAADDAPALVQAVFARWPTRTSTPTLSAADALTLRLRRTFWDAVRSSGPKGPELTDPGRAVWVVAGAFDRARVLTEARAALARPPAPPPPDLPRARPGPGPRVPLEVTAATRVALVGWAWPDPSPAALARLDGIAHLLARGPQSRLQSVVKEAGVQGLAVHVEAGPGGASLEALVHLGPTASATITASLVERALGDIGAGRTTGLELERLRAEVEARDLRRWAALGGRARVVAETALMLGDLTEAGAHDPEALDEPALRALARTLAGRAPVIVRTVGP